MYLLAIGRLEGFKWDLKGPVSLLTECAFEVFML
jgi:hypothetical protein